VRGEHDDGTEADGQREETLRDRVVPDRRCQQALPRRGDKVQDTVDGTVQRYCSYEQHDEDHVGKYRQEVCRLAGALHAAYHHQENRQPADEQRDRQTPIRRADTVIDVVLLVQNLLARLQRLLSCLINTYLRSTRDHTTVVSSISRSVSIWIIY